jgi:hypothetical protein
MMRRRQPADGKRKREHEPRDEEHIDMMLKDETVLALLKEPPCAGNCVARLRTSFGGPQGDLELATAIKQARRKRFDLPPQQFEDWLMAELHLRSNGTMHFAFEAVPVCQRCFQAIHDLKDVQIHHVQTAAQACKARVQPISAEHVETMLKDDTIRGLLERPACAHKCSARLQTYFGGKVDKVVSAVQLARRKRYDLSLAKFDDWLAAEIHLHDNGSMNFVLETEPVCQDCYQALLDISDQDLDHARAIARQPRIDNGRHATHVQRILQHIDEMLQDTTITKLLEPPACSHSCMRRLSEYFESSPAVFASAVKDARRKRYDLSRPDFHDWLIEALHLHDDDGSTHFLFEAVQVCQTCFERLFDVSEAQVAHALQNAHNIRTIPPTPAARPHPKTDHVRSFLRDHFSTITTAHHEPTALGAVEAPRERKTDLHKSYNEWLAETGNDTEEFEVSQSYFDIIVDQFIADEHIHLHGKPAAR